MNLDGILTEPIFETDKGLPAGFADITLADVGKQEWSLLDEDIPLPAAVINKTSMEHNARWMQAFLQKHDVLLAPHGKTAMSPQLFDLQLRRGAWGVTVATVQQLRVYRRFGVTRALMANQLIGADDIRYISSELQHDPEFEFYCLVDSVAGVERLNRLLGEQLTQPLRVLLEVGLPGGRAGCRDIVQAAAVANAVDLAQNLSLYGIECYEGISVTGNHRKDAESVSAYIAQVELVYQYCAENRLFASSKDIILSAGGSAYFDIIAKALPKIGNDGIKIIVRSGCYLVHDSGFYERLLDRVADRTGDSQDFVRLKPALEVWAYVQSVPEPGLAILTVGKRDISYDIELPLVQKWFRPGEMRAPRPVSGRMTVLSLDDQHAYLSFSDGDSPQVGDMLGLGVSHPCTTFDKWRLIWLVDDDYRVVAGIRTYF